MSDFSVDVFDQTGTVLPVGVAAAPDAAADNFPPLSIDVAIMAFALAFGHM